jgi:hypothetical protein
MPTYATWLTGEKVEEAFFKTGRIRKIKIVPAQICPFFLNDLKENYFV